MLVSAAGSQWLIRLPEMTLRPGESRQVAWTIDRNSTRPLVALTVDQARQARDAARQWWEHTDLPFETIQVPDPDIQGMLEACVRNIWQARELKQDLPAFHVGPTVYRGLWVVDGSFLLEAAAILGRGQDARAGVEYLLSHQKLDGSFEILPHFWKENGIVLWAASRHALLIQDPAWLRAHWPRLRAVVRAIETLRARASTDPKALEFGLLPPGEIDGGISNSTKPEYSNTYWCLAGITSAIAADRWLGESGDATAWQKEYDDFLAAYLKAAARDTRHDASGNWYAPTMMGNIDRHVPQRGQWAFCHAVYPGAVFAPVIPSQLVSSPCSARPRPKARASCTTPAGCAKASGPTSPRSMATPSFGTVKGKRRPKCCMTSPATPVPRASGARSRNLSARATTRSATCPITGPVPSSSVSAHT